MKNFEPLTGQSVSLEVATAEEIRSGGAGMEIRWGTAGSPFGSIFLARSPRGITHLSFFDDNETESLGVLKTDWPKASLIRDDELAGKMAKEIFSKKPTATQSPFALHVKGTVFQLKVWRGLLQTTEGGLSNYGELAAEIDMPKGSRAVGNAVGKNRISYLIPCHRVIRASGELGGYRWGSERKRAMLSWERVESLTQP